MAEIVLEERLQALGAELRFPDEDTLADDVLTAIGGRGTPWRRVLLVAAAVLLAVAAVAVAVPGARRSVARWLGFDELQIERVELVPPTVTAAPAPSALEEAGRRVGVRPVVAPALGEPVSVEAPLGRYVVVRYSGADGDVDVVTMPGTLEPGLFTKLIGTSVVIEPAEVAGEDAYWITGEPHVLMYVDDAGQVQEVRPAADTLVWQRGDVIVRVEGDLSLAGALAIAESVVEP